MNIFIWNRGIRIRPWLIVNFPAIKMFDSPPHPIKVFHWAGNDSCALECHNNCGLSKMWREDECLSNLTLKYNFKRLSFQLCPRLTHDSQLVRLYLISQLFETIPTFISIMLSGRLWTANVIKSWSLIVTLFPSFLLWREICFHFISYSVLLIRPFQN